MIFAANKHDLRVVLLFLLGSCYLGESGASISPSQMEASNSRPMKAESKARARQMVDTQLRPRGITDERVLRVMEEVPRHFFVSSEDGPLAYSDRALPIGSGQTISQPYIVAYLAQAAKIGANDRVLEIGTGSGYQAAVLGKLAKEVYSIEILPPLAKLAADRLGALGYKNVEVREGDGYQGWKEKGPFDVIVLTAAPPNQVPKPLLEQLAPGGRLVAPIGTSDQHLMRISKGTTGLQYESLLPVRFVPMTGQVEKLTD